MNKIVSGNGENRADTASEAAVVTLAGVAVAALVQPVGESASTSVAGSKMVGTDAASNGNGNGDGNNRAGLRSDPFADLAGLRLGQDFAADLGLAKPIATVPVRKPGKTSFIRVHPGEDFRFQTAVVELKDDGETYLVTRQLWPHLVNEPAFVPKVLVTYIARPGDVLALWPIRLPGPDGRLDDYNQSALNIGISLATKSWVRVSANRYLGAYEATVAPAGVSWGDPKWPDMPFPEILKLAFKDKVIESLDHPVLKRLRGEA